MSQNKNAPGVTYYPKLSAKEGMKERGPKKMEKECEDRVQGGPRSGRTNRRQEEERERKKSE